MLRFGFKKSYRHTERENAKYPRLLSSLRGRIAISPIRAPLRHCEIWRSRIKVIKNKSQIRQFIYNSQITQD